VRGKYDTTGVVGRKQGRSRYGAKKGGSAPHAAVPVVAATPAAAVPPESA